MSGDSGKRSDEHGYSDACACQRCAGVTRVEYAVRYDAPAVYAGIVSRVGIVRSLAESIARAEMQHPGGGFVCTVVQRTVSVSDWAEVSS